MVGPGAKVRGQGSEAHRLLHLSRGVLSFSLEVNGRSVLHDPLHRHLDELVEGVELLADQTLLIKVGAGGATEEHHNQASRLVSNTAC